MIAGGKLDRDILIAILLLTCGTFICVAPAPIVVAAGSPTQTAGTSAPGAGSVEDDVEEDDEETATVDSAAPRIAFGLGSIVGSYASTNIGRGGQSPVADVGVFDFDGAGRFSGTVEVNLPAADFRQRQLFRSTINGTYTVDPEGTGTTTATIGLPNGTTLETTTHFVITEHRVRSGTKTAKEIKLVVDDLSITSGNLDVIVLQKIPNGGFSNASLVGTYGFQAIGRGGSRPTADVGLTTFDGRGRTSVFFNQNIPGAETIPGTPGTLFFDRQVFSGRIDFDYHVNADGTGKSDVAVFVVTKAETIGTQLVATEVFFVADTLDPFTGNLQTTIATRRSSNLDPARDGFTLASLDGAYGGKVIGSGGPTQQVTAAILTFDGAGRFDGPGAINLPGPSFDERVIVEAPFTGTYTVRRDGFGTTLNGGRSYFVITKSKMIGGVKTATEFALVVEELQPTGNLIAATFTRLPRGGAFTQASLQGTYASNVIGYGGVLPEAGVGTFTFDGAGGSTTSFFQNTRGVTAFDRRISEGRDIAGSYTIAPSGLGRTFFPDPTGGVGESALVITKARVENGVKVAQEFFVVAKDYSPLSRNILASVGTRIGD